MSTSDISSFDSGDLRCAEDAVGVLKAVADLLESAGAGNDSYVGQLRRDAAAVASLTGKHPDAQDLTAPMSAVAAVSEHRELLRQRLRGLYQ